MASKSALAKGAFARLLLQAVSARARSTRGSMRSLRTTFRATCFEAKTTVSSSRSEGNCPVQDGVPHQLPALALQGAHCVHQERHQVVLA